MKKVVIPAIMILGLLVVAYVYFGPKTPPPRPVVDRSTTSKPERKAVLPKKVVSEATTTQNDGMETVITKADWAVLYNDDDIGKLANYADIIVEGKVVEVGYFDVGPITNTKLKFEVERSFKGSAKNGDILTFIDPGGITTLANRMRYNNKFNKPITQVEENKKIKFLLEGVPLAKVNDHVLYFAKSDTDMNGGVDYGSLGAFQSKFMIKNNIVERFIPQGWATSKFTSMRTSKADFERKVQKAVANN